MDKEFNFDQEDVKVTVVEDIEDTEDADYSDLSDDDFATTEEDGIDWSTL